MEHNFVVSTETGQIFGYDTRKIEKPVFSVHGHESACSQVIFSPHIPTMMCTAGTDGYVKVWDISSGSEAVEIAARDVKQGELFSLQFCRDIPWVLAAGGSQGQMAIWDLSESKRIEDQFKAFINKDSYKAEDYDPNAIRVEEATTAEGVTQDEYEDDDESEEEAKIEKKEKKDKKDKKDKKKKKKSKKEDNE